VPTGTARDCEFSDDDAFIAVAHDSTPFVSVYPWSGSGFGAKVSNPATLPANNAYDLAFSPTGGAIAITHDGTPTITAYPWSGSGFGTKYADPGTAVTGSNGRGIAFRPNGAVLLQRGSTGTAFNAYAWSDGSGFGTKYSAPASTTAGAGQSGGVFAY